jgi:hypothetical protein
MSKIAKQYEVNPVGLRAALKKIEERKDKKPLALWSWLRRFQSTRWFRKRD